MNQERMMIKVEKYYEAENADFKGIPFIEAWPPLTREIIGNLMASRISFRADERTHSADLRLQYTNRLMDFFIPLDHQIDFAQKLWNLICFGYKARKQVDVDPSRSFSELCASIEMQTVKASIQPHFKDSIWSGFLIGTPGTGKTSTPLALLRRLAGDLLHHPKHATLFQLLFIHVRVPAKAKGKSLAEAVFVQLLEMAAKTMLPIPYGLGTKPRTLHEYEAAIKVLTQKLNIGLIILDELQHLYARTGGMDQDSMKFLTEFLSMLKVPVLFIGTWDSIPLTGLEMRLGRRVTGACTGYFNKMDNGEEFHVFVQTLLSYQFTQKPAVVTEELVSAFYFHTQGIQDLTVKLLVLCQVEAILTETEEITPELVLAAGEEHMRVLSPAVKMLREGRREHDPDIWDLEPTDFNDYQKRFCAALRSRQNLHPNKFSPRDFAKSIYEQRTLEIATEALHVLGMSSGDDAHVLASSAVRERPAASAAEIVVSTIQKVASTRRGPKPTKSRDLKKQQSIAGAFAALDDLDLRKIAYFSSQQDGDCASAFAAKGVLRALHEDIPY
jgi:hypothetical protein